MEGAIGIGTDFPFRKMLASCLSKHRGKTILPTSFSQDQLVPFTFAADTVLLPGDAIATAHRAKDE